MEARVVGRKGVTPNASEQNGEGGGSKGKKWRICFSGNAAAYDAGPTLNTTLPAHRVLPG
jgi:hypothetical protein